MCTLKEVDVMFVASKHMKNIVRGLWVYSMRCEIYGLRSSLVMFTFSKSLSIYVPDPLGHFNMLESDSK